jgi:hypothetical protein
VVFVASVCLVLSGPSLAAPKEKAPPPAKAASAPSDVYGLSCGSLPEAPTRGRGCCFQPPMATGPLAGVSKAMRSVLLRALIEDANRRKVRVVLREETLRFLGVIPEPIDKKGAIAGEGTFRDLAFPGDFAGVPALMRNSASDGADPRVAGAADGYARLTAAVIELLFRYALKNEAVSPAPDQMPTFQNLDRKAACELVGVAKGSSLGTAFPGFEDYLREMTATAAVKR